MHYLGHFYNKTFKNDLVNKFFYKNTKELPQLKKIILNFGCKNTEVKLLASSLLALELITSQKGTLTTTKHSNIFLKIRKGNPVGCKVSLHKEKVFGFLEKILVETFSRTKNFDGLTSPKKIEKSVFSHQIKDTFSFIEIEERYYLFNNLPKLDMTIVTDTKTEKEMIFVLQSLQLPFKKDTK